MDIFENLSRLPPELLRSIITDMDYVATMHLHSTAVLRCNADIVSECNRRMDPAVYIDENLCEHTAMRQLMEQHNAFLWGPGPLDFYTGSKTTDKYSWKLVVCSDAQTQSDVISHMTNLGFMLPPVANVLQHKYNPAGKFQFTHYRKEQVPSHCHIDGPTFRENIQMYVHVLASYGYAIKTIGCLDSTECYTLTPRLNKMVVTTCSWHRWSGGVFPINNGYSVPMTKVHNGVTQHIDVIWAEASIDEVLHATRERHMRGIISYDSHYHMDLESVCRGETQTQ